MAENTARTAPAPGASGDVNSEVIDAFVSLADTLVAGYDPADLLQHLAESAVRLLGPTAAGILLADGSGQLRLVASSSEAVKDLELLQLQSDVGPCLECFATGATVVAVDPGDVEGRWPGFAPGMRAHGLLGVVAVPLRLRDQTLGALGMFSDRWHVPGPDAVRVAQGLADIATIGLLQERAASDARALASHLQTALDTRVLIEQAKGLIAAQLGTSVADAFLLLRSTARRRGTKLRDLSLALVEGRTDAFQLST